MRTLAIHTVALVLLLFLPSELRAQDELSCRDGRIASITIVTQPIFPDSANGASGMLGKLYAASNWLHVETREAVIRRELLVREGDCVDALRLSESERLLRGFGFLESASVETVTRPDGDVDVTVVTKDDWSLRLEPRFDFGGGFAVSGIKLGETNLDGRGREIELSYIVRPGPNDVVLTYFDPQFMKTRWDLGVGVIRSGPGWTVGEVLAFPFLGLVGDWAAFQNALYSERFFRYVVGDSNESTTELLLPTLQRAFGFGGALRSRAPPRGRSTRLASYGLSLTYDDTWYSRRILEDSIPGLLAGIVDSAGVTATIEPMNALQLNLVGGLRALDFVKRRGVATLGAVEDIALGASVDALVGVAPEWFGLTDSYLMVGLDLYGASRIRGNWFSVVWAGGEARRDYQAGQWNDVFAAIHWTNFWIVNRRSTNEIALSYSAGWETTVPFQLTLGGPYKLGGYTLDRFPGGERVTLRVENRYTLTQIGRLVDLGSVVFIDVGEMWANGALFGGDSDFRASAGVGLRFAAPAGSRQTYRLQFGVPLDGGVRFSDLVVSFSIDRQLRLEGRSADPQLARSRDIAISSARNYLK